MLIFDQLKREDPKLRAVTLMVLAGLGVLFVGLWWVQVVSAREYRESLETQSYRSVRIPAVRGNILDRNGIILAENRPMYNVSLYLEELRRPFDDAYFAAVTRTRTGLEQAREEAEKRVNRKLRKEERRQFVLTSSQKAVLKQQARYEVASNVVSQIGLNLRQPLSLEQTNFERHYQTRLALPLPVIVDLDATNIARFEEQLTCPMGVDLELQSTRFYPHQTVAGHLLGFLRRSEESVEGEESFFSYRLPDFRGELGIEYGYDKELRGLAGAKSVQVNNIGYRTTEAIWSPAEPGQNVVLTLDLLVQAAAEQALAAVYGPTTRGAAVVMDVRSGDILAMVSSPSVNPNHPVYGFPPGELQRLQDTKLRPQFNRATQGNYAPGSVFKLIVSLAALEAGLNHNEIYRVAANPRPPYKGVIYVGAHHRPIKDTVDPGDYDFRRALKLSSNAYFVTNGLRVGPERIVRLGQRVHLGERIGLPLRQETAGSFPTLRRLNSGWTEGNTANLSIGQDPVEVTPLQVAVLTSAIANGGKVLWPRLVDRIEPRETSAGELPVVFPAGRVRDDLRVSTRTLNILHEAMLADTEDADGTGRHVRDHDPLPGLRICGKTGTAEIQNENNVKTGQTTWFASFAPYGAPRWAVVVMVEDGASGGLTCSPVAGRIYAALLESERKAAGKSGALAGTQ
jgi:penicillin-binding protein 2